MVSEADTPTGAEKAWERIYGVHCSNRCSEWNYFKNGFEAGQKAERERILKIVKWNFCAIGGCVCCNNYKTKGENCWVKKIEGDKDERA